MEDQAETILFHICRGSSIAGLRGMLPVSGRLIRPLLDETRDRIETYLREKRQTWRTDETNQDPSYTRNRLRLQILPLLEQYVNPAALRHLARLGTEAARTEEYLAARTEEALDRCRIPAEGDSGTDRRRNDNRTGVFVSRLLQEPGLLQQRILYLLLTGAAGRKKDIGEVHILALLKLARTPGSGRLDLPAGYQTLVKHIANMLYFRGGGSFGILGLTYGDTVYLSSSQRFESPAIMQELQRKLNEAGIPATFHELPFYQGNQLITNKLQQV
jgi:tRNA(Ile)-lysidine synthase